MRPDATHALLGSDGAGSVGIVSTHSNEFEAHLEAKRINAGKGKVKVVPVMNGDLLPEHQAEKAELFERHYNRVLMLSES